MGKQFFEFLKDITNKKEYLYNEDTAEDYSPYMINRYLSMDSGTALYAQETNLMPNIDPQMHHDYMFYGLRKMNRYFDYTKKIEISKKIKVLGEYFNYSWGKARDIQNLFTDEDVENIAKQINYAD